MLSPVAVSWMIGKSMLEYRFGPVSRWPVLLGWENPAFFASPELAKITIMVMDAWTFIPFMMIMLLAGLQAMPKELTEAASVDGATGWQAILGGHLPADAAGLRDGASCCASSSS